MTFHVHKCVFDTVPACRHTPLKLRNTAISRYQAAREIQLQEEAISQVGEALYHVSFCLHCVMSILNAPVEIYSVPATVATPRRVW